MTKKFSFVDAVKILCNVCNCNAAIASETLKLMLSEPGVRFYTLEQFENYIKEITE